tara:strand:+ start:421 stop:666 length:246 start_codon:yes stop_codon:yes gene_type:complete
MKSTYHLSDQALGAVMMALQRSLMEQTDIVPVLKSFVIENSDQGLIIKNPPIIKFDDKPETDEADSWVADMIADADRNSGA